MSRSRPWALLALTLAAGLTVYWPVRDLPFFTLDDGDYVTENPIVQGEFFWRNFRSALVEPHARNWHPAVWWSLMIDQRLHGGDPGGFHFTNLCWHLAATAALFGFLYSATGKDAPSAFVAAFFALHPQHVESVAWITERKDVLFAFWGFLALWLYVWHSRRPSTARLTLVTTAFAASLMAKQMLMTMPALLLLLDFWPLRRWPSSSDEYAINRPTKSESELITEKLPFVGLSAVAAWLLLWARKAGEGPIWDEPSYPIADRLGNAVLSTGRYLVDAFWPASLAIYYPFPSPIPWGEIAAWSVILLAITVLAITTRRQRPYFFVGWFWFLLTLAPVIGIVQDGRQARADRYVYWPHVGLFIAVAFELERWAWRSRRRRWLAAISVTAALAAMGMTCREQLERWREPRELFELTAATTPGGNWFAENALGGMSLRAGDLAAAETHFRRVIELAPEEWSGYANLATCLIQQGKPVAAEKICVQGLQRLPGRPALLVNQGLARAANGRVAEAIDSCRQALDMNPRFSAARSNLALLLADAGQYDAAFAEIDAALAISPKDASVRVVQGTLFLKRGKLHEAADAFRAALDLTPTAAEARYSLGMTLFDLGDANQAIEQLDEGLRLTPRHKRLLEGRDRILAATRRKQGDSFAAAGRWEEAKTQYEALVALRPQDADARVKLGGALAAQGQFVAAQRELEHALSLDPQNLAARRNLAIALDAIGDSRGAIEQLTLVAERQPDSPEAQARLGLMQEKAGQVGSAARSFSKALALRSDWPDIANRLAWVRATSATERNGHEALSLIERALKGSTARADYLDTKGAALAELGRFAEAVDVATAAERLARASGRIELANQIAARRALYASGKPYRSPTQQ